jgi:tetratricopeptide (TPR) repeat protein
MTRDILTTPDKDGLEGQSNLDPQEFRLQCSEHLAMALLRQGRFLESRILQSSNLKEKLNMLSSGHERTWITMGNLATVYMEEGKLKVAEALSRRALEQRRIHFGDSAFNTLTAMTNYAEILRRRGNFNQAERQINEVIGLKKIHLPKGHERTVMSARALARILEDQERHSEATQILRDAIQNRLNENGDLNLAATSAKLQLAGSLGVSSNGPNLSSYTKKSWNREPQCRYFMIRNGV